MSNSGGMYTWSKVANNNASADNTVAFPEGQSPGSLNDGCRALMASAAKFRDDISGSIVTTGISVAYIVATNQVFDTLAHMGGQEISFTPHVTNAAGGVTVTVDTFANIPLRSSPGVELPAGVLIAGTPYAAIYNAADAALYLRGGVSKVYDVPPGITMIWWDDVLPTNGLWAWANGQIIANANTVCPILLARWSTRFGGNGATTMGVPDTRDTVPVGKSTMGGVTSRALHTLTNTVLGTLFGLANNTLLIANMPAHDHGGTTGDDTPDHTHNTGASPGANGVTYAPNAGASQGAAAAASIQSGGANARHHHSIPAQGSATPVNNVQPSTTCNYILRLA